MGRSTQGTTFYGLLREAVLQPMVGWDFGWLEGRVTRGEFPWNYTEMVRERARRSPDLLDLGTGGGEWLSQLDPRPPRTVATESYPPNVRVARRRLAPLRVDVVWTEETAGNAEQERRPSSALLPFRDGAFHLVANKHESYVPREVARVLAPGGRFVTQQVGSEFRQDWYRLFGRRQRLDTHPAWDLALARRQLEREGLEVLGGAEGSYVTKFLDVGAVVWYLRAIPWTLPDFQVDSEVETLKEVHHRIQAEGPLEIRLPGFWLEASRPSRTTCPTSPPRGQRRSRR